MQLVKDVRNLLEASPQVGAILDMAPFNNFPELMGALFASLTGNTATGATVSSVFGADSGMVEMTIYDITETARRNFEPGGPPATLLFARGVQAVIAHRVAHHLWEQGDHNLALAVKSTCGRALSTDIHPAARIGAGLWLDHGLGFVVGETCVIEEDVSIWHNVTLGSTLNDDGPSRHPHIERGAVIGAGATLLGNITVGAGANIGAGAIVLGDVPAGGLVVGHKAQPRGQARVSFTAEGAPS